MKLVIGIVTYKRIKKMERLLKSIKENTFQDYEIVVMVDNNDVETVNYFKNTKIYKRLNKRHEYVIGNWNKFIREFHLKAEMLILLVDDVELFPDCIQNAVNCMNSNFPDLDGIVGISQCAPEHPRYTWMPYGQVLIGRNFIERYKPVNYQVCMPDYLHFYQDEELWKYATALNKFVLCKEAMLIHYHPGFYREEKDETHKLIRVPEIKGKDIKTYNLRKSKGLIWGQSWERTNDNKCF